MGNWFSSRFLYVNLFIVLLSGCAQSFNTEGLNLIATGQYSKAVMTLEPLDLNYHTQPFDKLIYLCWAYVETRRFDRVFDCLDVAQEKVDAGNYNADLWNHSATVPRLRAQAQLEIGDYKGAVHAAEMSMEIIISKGLNTYDILKTQGVLGLAYQKNGDFANARRIRDELVNYQLSFFESLLHEELFAAKARLLLAMGDYKTVSELDWAVPVDPITLMARGFAGQDIFNSSVLPFKYMEAKSLLESGQIEKAEEKYNELLAFDFNVSEFSGIYHYLLHDRARLALNAGNSDEAIILLKQSVTTLERFRHYLTTEASRIGFAQDKQAVYALLIQTLIETGNDTEALSFVERAKARALVDMLADRKQFNSEQLDASFVSNLMEELDRLEDESLDQVAANSQTINDRSVETDKLKTMLKTNAPELASLITVSALSVNEIQNLLGSDESLVEYYYMPGGAQLTAFVVTRDSVTARVLDANGIDDAVQNFRSALQAFKSDAWKDIARQLYKRLLKPLEADLNKQNLLIVPHGVLHYLPFNALLSGNEMVVDKWGMRLLPSASVLQFINQPSKAIENMLVLGNPDLGDPQYDLIGAEKEARAITDIWEDARVLLRENATETILKKAGSQFKYLHLASHGQFSADDPLKSRMLLAPDDENDGNLYVDEIYDLRLDADLVTLSACETGMGDVKSGDDVIGLTRGFLYAGAKSIIASLWPVSDAATEILMKKLYTEMKTGTDRREALRLAQLTTREKYPHPAFWAAFQLTGAVN